MSPDEGSDTGTPAGDALPRKTDASQAPIRERDTELALPRRQLAATEAAALERDRLENRVHALQRQLEATRAMLQERDRALESLRRELESLWGSRSWRYTRALREGGVIARDMLRRLGVLATPWGSRPTAPALFLSSPERRLPPESRPGAHSKLSPESARVFEDLTQLAGRASRRR